MIISKIYKKLFFLMVISISGFIFAAEDHTEHLINEALRTMASKGDEFERLLDQTKLLMGVIQRSKDDAERLFQKAHGLNEAAATYAAATKRDADEMQFLRDDMLQKGRQVEEALGESRENMNQAVRFLEEKNREIQESQRKLAEMVQKGIQDANQIFEKMKKERVEVEVTRKEVESKLQDADKTLQEARNLVNNDLVKKQEELQRKFVEAQEKYQKELQQEQQKHEAEMQKKREEFQKKMDTEQKEYEKKNRQSQKKLQEKLQKDQEKLQKDLLEQQKAFQEKLHTERKQYEQELEDNKRKLQEKMHKEAQEQEKKLQEEKLQAQKERQEDLQKHEKEQLTKELDATKQRWDKAFEVVSGGAKYSFDTVMDTATSPKKMAKVALGAGALGTALYASRHGNKVFWGAVKKYMMTPKLVQDTDIPTLFGRAKNSLFGKKEVVVDFDRLILAPDIKSHVMKVAQGAKEITRFKEEFSELNYQNVCFYGPPGTGKTMAAKMLAGFANMRYAYINGGDVAKLKKNDAILQLEELFAWANNSGEGLLLFIDEADSFLCDREGASEDLKQMVNAFIAQCGTSSKKFMIVTATNHVHTLDSAVRSRLEHFIPFEYPQPSERKAIIDLYLDTFTKDKAGNQAATINDDINFRSVLEKTKNFSGRDLEKMVNDVVLQAKMHHKGEISDALFQSVARTWQEMLPVKRKMVGE